MQITIELEGVEPITYDVYHLLQYLHSHMINHTHPSLPGTTYLLSPDEVDSIYSQVDNSFPTIYIITLGDHATPFTFTTLENAIRFVTLRQEGSVYGVAQLDDPILYDLLYPFGLEGMESLFAIRTGLRTLADELEADPLTLGEGFGFSESSI
jgi:hypothetical protein